MGTELLGLKFTVPKREVSKIFVHCSASDRPEDDNVETINSWHIARGWNGIGYHYYIDKAGRIWFGRDIEKIPAAQFGFNTGSIAICCGGEKEFPDVQMAVLKSFSGVINDSYKAFGKAVTFHGHCEVNPAKTCPNYDYKKVLGLDIKGDLI